MKEFYKLSELGLLISSYIKSESQYGIGEVGKEVFGIHATNMTRKLRGEGLKLTDVDRIIAFLELPIKITIGEITAGNQDIDTEEYLNMQRKLLQCYEERESLKKEIAKLKA